jgi:hypothetical protein
MISPLLSPEQAPSLFCCQKRFFALAYCASYSMVLYRECE